MWGPSLVAVTVGSCLVSVQSKSLLKLQSRVGSTTRPAASSVCSFEIVQNGVGVDIFISKDLTIMHFLWCLFSYIRAEHISGLHNVVADSLS